MPEDKANSLTKAYDDWHALVGPDEGATAPWHEMVKKRIGNIEGLDILEIGCGRGGFTQWLATHHPRTIVGADFSRVAVDYANRLCGGGVVQFRVADICDIPAVDAAFDVVVSCETIEHVVTPRAGIRELFRVLRPGGKLLLTTPNYMNLLGMHRGYLRSRNRRYTEAGQPVNNFTSIPRVYVWLRRAGFQLLEISALGHYVPCPGRRPIRIESLDRETAPMRWLGHHSIFVAERPA